MQTQTIQVPLSDYNHLKEELALLKNSDLLKTMNKLIEMLYQDKYGLYMGDLAEHTINKSWDNKPSVWDSSLCFSI
jgi:hypothetical protein